MLPAWTILCEFSVQGELFWQECSNSVGHLHKSIFNTGEKVLNPIANGGFVKEWKWLAKQAKFSWLITMHNVKHMED